MTTRALATQDDDAWRAVHPEGLALALLVSASVFGSLTIIVMTLRIVVRLRTSRWGLDDWTMLAGFTVNLAQCAVVIYGAYTGIGTRDAKLNKATHIEGYKTLLIWQSLYAGCVAFIKSSICLTLIRITPEKLHKTILWTLICFSAVLSIIGLIVIVNQCHPLAKYWDASLPGTCWPPIAATVLSYAASVVNVLTDFTVAIIPFFILRKIQMRSRLKLYVHLILGMGILAGIASIIRVPFTNAYMSATDIIFHSGNIVLWTVFECGFGIIAGSLPTLRAFFKSLQGDQSTPRYNVSNDTQLVTIGRVRGQRKNEYDYGRNKAVLNVTIAANENDNDGNHDDDNNSTSRIVRIEREVRQTVSQESHSASS